MKKISYTLLLFTVLFSLFTSCTEQAEVGEYDNWPARNMAFLDSIASVCDKNADGTWAKFCAYTLDEEVEAKAPSNLHYVYVQKLESGDGEYSPLFKDSVRVHYMGRLIPSESYPQGRVFDKSYSTYDFNEKTDVPSLFLVSNMVVGFSTALMQMVEGDRWRVYIPYYLGYGTSASDGAIPGYSTLIFDIKMARIYRFGIDKDTSWH